MCSGTGCRGSYVTGCKLVEVPLCTIADVTGVVEVMVVDVTGAEVVAAVDIVDVMRAADTLTEPIIGVEVARAEVVGVAVTGAEVIGVEVKGVEVTGVVIGAKERGSFVSATGFVLVSLETSPLSTSDEGRCGYWIVPPPVVLSSVVEPAAGEWQRHHRRGTEYESSCWEMHSVSPRKCNSGIKNLLNSDTGDSMRGGGLAWPPMSPTAAAGHDFALSSPGGALVALPWLPGSPPTGFPAGGWPGTSEPEGMLEGV